MIVESESEVEMSKTVIPKSKTILRNSEHQKVICQLFNDERKRLEYLIGKKDFDAKIKDLGLYTGNNII